VVITLAVIFLVLAGVVGRSRRVSAAESWILFLAGVFFWASGIGSSLWVLLDTIYHAIGGGH
jgi:hypothetical protein